MTKLGAVRAYLYCHVREALCIETCFYSARAEPTRVTECSVQLSPPCSVACTDLADMRLCGQRVQHTNSVVGRRDFSLNDEQLTVLSCQDIVTSS